MYFPQTNYNFTVDRGTVNLQIAAIAFCFALGGSPLSAASDFSQYKDLNFQSKEKSGIKFSCINNKINIKFTADQNSPWKDDILGNKGRSEIQSRKRLQFDTPYTVEYDVKIIKYDKKNISHLVIGQFHQSSDPGDFQGYPAVEISLEPNGLAIYTASDSNRRTPKPYPQIARSTGIPFNIGEWHRIKITSSFSFSEKGSLTVILDGRVIYNDSNISNAFNDRIGPYWKFGSYFRSTTKNNIVEVAYKNMNFLSVSNMPSGC